MASGKCFQPGIRTSEEQQQKVLVVLSMSQPLDHQNWRPFSQCSWFSFFPHCSAMLDICQKDVFLRLTPLIDKHGIDHKRQMPNLQGQSSSPWTEGECSLSEIIQQHIKNKMQKTKPEFFNGFLTILGNRHR